MSAEAERRTEHIPEWKKEEVADLTQLIEHYESIGIVDISGIPSKQFQAIRAGLHGAAEIRVSRNTLIRRALEDVNSGFETLVENVTKQVALVGTDHNPFSLYRRLEESKTPAPINAGEEAPKAIVIPAGDTGIPPGPFVGDLQNVGAAARIDEGSIKVTQDSTVAEAGDVVSSDLAVVLSELGIEPSEVGLDVRVVYSNGVRFEASELAIDVDEYRTDIQHSVARARALSLYTAYPTTQTTPELLAKADLSARLVGIAAAIESPDLVSDLVGQASARLQSLAAHIEDKDALPDELRSVEPAPSETTDESPSEQETETETEPESEPDDATDDDDDVSGEGLGDLFG